MFTVEEFTEQNQEFITNALTNMREDIVNGLKIDGYFKYTYSFHDETPIGAIYILMSKLSQYFRELGWFLSSQELDGDQVQFRVTVRPS
ncbi:hypothetical protein H8F06_10315 [Vibrio fluvialis]|uniref:hypothetical protein n=1 Tax=Vibrio fluvialis TaxID=676 RepID=UPI00192C947B|nr:hypothetical protein [Vibrio fluvialis]MBL4295701.1 hypothetical protein [Vibrio fluvialis]